ncbi:MAG TPA: histone-like nucleoid-structuring protein Lsr2 [Acidimicrobiales bacterium]|nr:histone-like nucleoid-structuring protein Lsr2 [Acidimicrobiales bacterium]
MARQRQIIETVTCDLCGEETGDATAVTLGWGREQWELDLCPQHNAELSAQFDQWTSKGRRATGGRSARANGSGGSRATFGTTTDANAVREWAKSNGFKVGDKGRIAADVRAAYEAATNR